VSGREAGRRGKHQQKKGLGRTTRDKSTTCLEGGSKQGDRGGPDKRNFEGPGPKKSTKAPQGEKKGRERAEFRNYKG